ncbi:MAG: type II secretion system F family protein [Pseudomonadales bacterium]|jgi:type IV pilus assembly protein PilC|nr:type II secretion system F family protein [Pseudomonadales bacterium]
MNAPLKPSTLQHDSFPQTSVQQTTFHWQGRDARGAPRQGELQAPSRALAKARLQRQGLRELRLRRQTASIFSPTIKAREITLFTRQLATMIKANLPLVQSFELMIHSMEHGPLRERLTQLRDAVAAGEPFSTALRRYPREFEELYCNLVAAGESSGAFDVLLERLAKHLEQAQALRARVKKALRYPLIVLTVALAVTALLLVKVVPAFAATFADLGAELPSLTRGVLYLSTLAQAWWPWFLGGALGVFLTLRSARQRSRRFKDWCERRLLQVPLLGRVAKFAALARFCRTLATTFAAGLPLVDALAASAGASGNAAYRAAILQARTELATGIRLSRTLRQSALFPPLLVQLLAAGEDSGTLDTFLSHCADIYESEADTLSDKLTTLLEPLLMAALGLIVGTLLLALYLPLFQLGSVL